MIQVRTVIWTVMTMRAIRVTVIDLLMVVLIERERITSCNEARKSETAVLGRVC